ncbi:uncharacterized protein LOC125869683 [Solanum stenotomum]|uniref:uncharacterized protein LOC125869683 n=1 Tax=Solanum stenotomum TaxID=172797 RepID=UPI0020D05E42|nr:uncharacterized protein LOC125869683 [Solanum stenotomum]
MDFITGLPFSFKSHDSIWVTINWLTKLAHFLPVKSNNTAEEYSKLYVREVVRLHGTPLTIISYWGAQFKAHFWRSFQKILGTQNLPTIIDIIQALAWLHLKPSMGIGADRLLSRQKSYADVRRRDIEFQVDDWVFLKVIPIEGMEFSEHLSYEEVLVAILDRQVRKLRTKDVASVKVLWRSQNIEEATWEAEADMRAKYPHLFQ